MELGIFFIILFVNLSLFSGLIYFIYKIKTRLDKIQRRSNANEISLNLLLDGNFSLNKKTKKLESNYANLIQHISKNKISSQSIQSDQKFYRQAKQLKKIGADSDEIKHSCNLSQMEMELIEALDDQNNR